MPRNFSTTLIPLTIAALLFVTGCSSAHKKLTSEDQPDVVISRIDNLKERPEWIKESEPFRIENGKVLSLGQTQIPSDHRVEAAYRIAENNGKAAIASAIEQRLEFIFQGAEEGTSLTATQARFIGAEASKLTTNSLRLDRRYWEKVATTEDSGNRVTRYRIFTLVSMPEEDFKQALMNAIRKSRGQTGLSDDFGRKVDAHWDQFASPSTVKQ